MGVRVALQGSNHQLFALTHRGTSTELWESVATLLRTIPDEKQTEEHTPFDHIVIECSGVANPKAILENFAAELIGGLQQVIL